MASTFADLAEHTGTLVALIGYSVLLCGILVGVVWKVMIRVGENLKNDLLAMIRDVDGKIENHLGDSARCKADLPQKYALKEDMAEELKFIKSQQYDLRTAILPRDYVRSETLKAWESTMKQGFDDIGSRLDAVSKRLDGFLAIKGREGGP